MDKIIENSQEKSQDVQNSGHVDGDYLVGLDIGTDSIGWAVTDTEYNLLRARRRELWGSYLFDEASTAEERRVFRTSRRRTARIRERLDLLQSLFAGEISKVDETFFLRLNDGKLLAEDKDERITTKYILFGDKGYGDPDYFKTYPTVFHLRNALMTSPPADIRLLYIACHHIVKNRGHFLFEGQNFDVSDKSVVRRSLGEANELLGSEDDSIAFSLDDADAAAEVIKDVKLSRTDKFKKLCPLLGADKDKRLKECVKAIVGNKFDLKIVFELDDGEKYTFDSDDFDTKRSEIGSAVGDDGLEFIDKLKAVYDYGKLAAILGDCKYLSEARVKSFETHKADLAMLKAYVRAVCPQKYKEVFRRAAVDKPKGDDNTEDSDKEKEKGKANYAAYIGMDKHKSYAKVSQADFCAYIKKNICTAEQLRAFVLQKIARDNPSPAVVELWKTSADRLEAGEFCPKQITSNNGVIPYQLHLAELDRILKTASAAFPFLTQADGNGLTVSDKIKMLVSSRIPYYVGPLGGGKHAWAVRKPGMEKVKVTPWNFDTVIDRDASEDAFITRMTSKCSYLPTEDVLPKNSLLYSEAVFLNELNNLKINGEKSCGVRQIVLDFARKNKKVGKKTIVKLLAREGVVLENGVDSVSGIDDVMTSSLSSYINFHDIIGDRVDTERDMCENIIKWITLFSDKSRLEKRIRKEYGDRLSDAEIKRIKGLNYSGWGRLSKKLLDGITSDRVTPDGVPHTVIETLRLETLRTESGKPEYINLTEALTASRWGFSKVIAECNSANAGRVTEQLIDEQYISPAIKRAVRRTVDLVKEIVKIEGKPPKKICIEMARGNDGENKKGNRTKSRKETIVELYKNIESDVRTWNADISMPSGTDERKFVSDKVLLYYTQMGKCMYTGKPINFEDLFNTNIYDIDHIYPQSKINDDSLDNRVLVVKTANARKTDTYPIDGAIREKMEPFWKMLKDKKLISESKYKRLVRVTAITPEEQAEFENRQLVATRQSTKAVATILKTLLPDTEIVYSKAKKASDFKNKFGLVKVRELNDLHHAKDAYVNIIVGNTLNEQFGHDARRFYMESPKPYSDYRLFDRKVKSAWNPEWLGRISAVYNSNRMNVVRFVNEGHGALYNATIKTAGANDKLIPLKENGKISDTAKYGGYDNATTAYFALVESKDKKGNAVRSLEAVSILVDLKAKRVSKKHREYIEQYLAERGGLREPKILIPKIRQNALVLVNGTHAYLRGKTGNSIVMCNADELWLDSCGAETVKDKTTAEYTEKLVGGSVEYLKKVAEFNKKYVDAKKFKREIECDEAHDRIFAARISSYTTRSSKSSVRACMTVCLWQNSRKFSQAKEISSSLCRRTFSVLSL